MIAPGMRKNHGNARGVVITSQEALEVLGIRRGSLVSLERAAKVRHIADRVGYTNEEFKRLLSRLRRILRH